MTLEHLPASLGPLLAGYDWQRVTIGATSARTYHLSRQGSPGLYLKIDRPPGSELTAEKDVLQWLSAKLSVPRALALDSDAGNEYLLMSEIPGLNAVDAAAGITGVALVKLLASGLRLVHAVPAAHCPFDRSLDIQIAAASHNVEQGLVDESRFDQNRIGRTALDLLSDLTRLRPSSEDLAFTHGDYCLPNVIIDHDKISGFVDLSRAGIGDRYRDIALAVRSIKRNLGPGFENTFFEAYGLGEPDPAKIAYYQLVDEFF